MTRGLLIVAAIIDVGLAALLIAVSGFIIGGGPQSMNAGLLGQAAFFAAVIGCVAAPVIGFILNARRRPAGGLLVAWLPPIMALFALVIPPNY